MRTLLVPMLVALAAGSFAGGLCGGRWTADRPPAAPAEHRPRRAVAVGNRAVQFEENLGQTDPSVAFVARTRGATVFVTPVETVFAMRSAAFAETVRMSIERAAPRRPCGERPLAGRVNSYVGDDPSRWVRGARTFGAVRIPDTVPGVDLLLRGAGLLVEYDLEIAPGADTSALVLRFDGADDVTLDPAGDLVVAAGAARMHHRRPIAWDCAEGGRRAVRCEFRLLGDGRVGFDVEGHDPSARLVIDPVVFSTFLGGDEFDEGYATAFTQGRVAVVGGAGSLDFPLKNSAMPPKPDNTRLGCVTIYEADGSDLHYSTYFGGSARSQSYGVVSDPDGALYITGSTNAADFPTTPGAYGTAAGIYVVKLDADGALVYSTTVASASIYAIAVDSGRNAVICGRGNASYPTTPGSFHPAFDNDSGFVTKINPTGTALVWSTFLGGSSRNIAQSVAVDSNDDLFVVGRIDGAGLPVPSALDDTYDGNSDAFVAKLSADGTTVIWDAFLGGTGYDSANAVAVDEFDRPVVAGDGNSLPFPVTADAVRSTQPFNTYEAFVTVYAGAGTSVVFSTLLGGDDDDDYALGVGVAPGPILWVGGDASSEGFPVTPDAFQSEQRGSADSFLTAIDLSGASPSILYSTFLGGADGGEDLHGVAVSPAGVVSAVGCTDSADFPTVNAYQAQFAADLDFFVFVLAPGGGPPPGGTTTDSYYLPKTVKLKLNAKDASKDFLRASGFFDTGSGPAQFTSPATIVVGTRTFANLTPEPLSGGKKYRYRAAGVDLTITPSKTGSSRGKFVLLARGALAGVVAADAPVALHFEDATVDADGEVTLAKGAYHFARVRGALVKPRLFLAKAKAAIAGGGADKLQLSIGMATNGVTPPAAPDVTIEIGALKVVVPAASFSQKGDVFSFKGAPGQTSVVLDFRRELLAVKGKALDLGAIPEGASAQTVTVTVGNDVRRNVVRMVRSAKSLRY